MVYIYHDQIDAIVGNLQLAVLDAREREHVVGQCGQALRVGAYGASGGNHYYSIDARGTDPVLTEQRTRVAIMAAHNSAVGTGFRVQQEHLKRTPQR